MRWFLSRGAPPVSRLLFVESGPRGVVEKVLPRIRNSFGHDIRIDLLTCLPTDPAELGVGNPHSARAWRVTECRDADSRWDLLCRIRRERHPAAVIVCADSPVMLPWKLAAVLLLPAKFIIVNENADYFWLDRAHLSNLKNLLLQRAGLQPDLAVRLLARTLVFPFTLVYLLGYAAWVHSRRAARRALGSWS